MNFNIKSLLKDQTVLYVVLFFAVTNFFGYILLNNYDAVIFMVLVGLITSYFSKNMILILLSSIVVTTFLTGASTVKEGLTNKAPAADADTADDDKDKKKKDAAKPADDSASKAAEPTAASLAAGTDADKKKPVKTEGFQDELSPSSLDREQSGPSYSGASEDTENEESGVNSAENALNNLDKILGSNGGAGTLLQNQDILMKNMKNLEPLIASTSKMIEGLNSSGLIGNLSKVSDRLNQ